MRSLYARFAVCLAITSAFALGWTTEVRAGDTAPPTPCKPTLYMAAKESTPEDAAERVAKQISALQEQLTALQAEESQITMKVLPAIDNAKKAGKIEDTGKVRDAMADGKPKGEWREYKQVSLAAAQQWQALADKYGRMKPQIKALERDRDKASPDGQAMIDSLGKRVSDKVHALIEKSGDAYYQVAEFKKALPLFMSVYQEIPEDKRVAEKALTEKIADLCGKTGDPKTATHLYEGLYKAMSENDRKNWATFDLRHNMAKFYFEKMNDYKMALEIYKGMLETIEPAKRDTDGGWIKKEITKCEEKLGGKSSSTPAGGKGNPATKAGGH